MKVSALLRRLRPDSRENAFLSPRHIGRLLVAAGALSFSMAMAGAIGWLSVPQGHFLTLMATMIIQFVSAFIVRIKPLWTLPILTVNLVLYIGTIALIAYFNPDQKQILFATFFPVMAAFLIISTEWGVIATVLALLIPRVVSDIDRDFLITYEIFMLIGALTSFWLGRLYQQLMDDMRQAIDRLDHQASHDPLTGALNRRGLHEQASVLVALHRRNQAPLSVALLDLDFFKQVNDRYGHEAGDVVLRTIVERLNATFQRRSDLIGRLGGDELVVILPETTMETACKKLEAFARELQQHRPEYHTVELPIALSIGVAALSPTATDLDTLLEEADERVYQAKAHGRSHICCSSHCVAIKLSFKPL